MWCVCNVTRVRRIVSWAPLFSLGELIAVRVSLNRLKTSGASIFIYTYMYTYKYAYAELWNALYVIVASRKHTYEHRDLSIPLWSLQRQACVRLSFPSVEYNCLHEPGDTHFSRRTRRKSFPLEFELQRYSGHTAERRSSSSSSSSGSSRCFCRSSTDNEHAFGRSLLNESHRNRDATRKGYAGATPSSPLLEATKIIEPSSREGDNEVAITKKKRLVNHRPQIRRRFSVNRKRVLSGAARPAIARNNADEPEKSPRKEKAAKRPNFCGIKRRNRAARSRRCCGSNEHSANPSLLDRNPLSDDVKTKRQLGRTHAPFDSVTIIGPSSSEPLKTKKKIRAARHGLSKKRADVHFGNTSSRKISNAVSVTKKCGWKLRGERAKKRFTFRCISYKVTRCEAVAASTCCCCCCCCCSSLSAEIRAAAAAAAATGNGRIRRRRRDATASLPPSPPPPLPSPSPPTAPQTRTPDRAARRLRRERRARCLAPTTLDSRRGRVVRGCCSKKVCLSVIAAPRRECRAIGNARTVLLLAERPRRRDDESPRLATSTITTYEFIPNTRTSERPTFDAFADDAEEAQEEEDARGDIIVEEHEASCSGISASSPGKKLRVDDLPTTGNSSGSSPASGSADVFARTEKREVNGDSGDDHRVKYHREDPGFHADDTLLLEDLVSRIEILLRYNGNEWLKNAALDADMKSKSRDDSREDMTSDAIDPNEDTERYDEFNTVMVPVARTLSKSPQSDEGIEPDTERRKTSVARRWSLDSANPGDDDTSRSQTQLERRKSKQKVTRCCSSDSAVLSDEEQVKGWENMILCDGVECESTEGRPRYWRTPSVVVSDYSDYSYHDEKYERSDPDLEKYEGGISGTPSQASSCSCLDCDEIREFQDLTNTLDSHLLQVCGRRRHSDSCCACLSSNSAINNGGINEPTNRRNSCLASPSPYRYNNGSERLDSGNVDYTNNERHSKDENKTTIELLNIPPPRKISDCSTNSSLSGDDFEVTELQPLKRPQSSGWRKLRNIVQWTPFFQTYKKQRYPWVQLAGHQGNFRAGPTPGTILKKLCPQEEACFRLLMRDVLRPYVPEFKGVLDVRESEDNHQDTESTGVKEVEEDSHKGPIIASYLQLQDLLGDFEQPCVMDCKVGVRTYLESELAKAKERPKLRKDMYEKMIQVDPSAPNSEERRVQGVTKPRYMVWRETISSTATLGFRVEGIKLGHGGSSKDFKTTRTREQVTDALKRFVENYPHAVPKYLQRLKAIRATLKASPFFASHEVVGSSLLFVHDAKNAGVWMIDFAKTLPLPPHLPSIQHDAEWQVGNHEDGYLIGVNNLIDIFQDIRNSET